MKGYKLELSISVIEFFIKISTEISLKVEDLFPNYRI